MAQPAGLQTQLQTELRAIALIVPVVLLRPTQFYGETHYLDGVDEFWADVLPASRMKEIQIKENYPVPCDV